MRTPNSTASIPYANRQRRPADVNDQVNPFSLCVPMTRQLDNATFESLCQYVRYDVVTDDVHATVAAWSEWLEAADESDYQRIMREGWPALQWLAENAPMS